ncbi:MAG TPA: methylated-DNA--[protein]-cysteine S-methyltransferase [Hyphomonadaceae bacterium]|nr:methylated-DNA--[protein]-cysteine S-methyltransferase [Hyphomonadaceae bacterium]HPN06276.1 methylated-DNA--[protein]-cysteine S-methyltransferase [Hyphomonadaceae bacterium]
MSHYSVFETAIGWAGVAWGERGLIGAYLPEPDPETVRTSFAAKFPGATETPPPLQIARVVEQIRALMLGQKVDMSDAPLDWSRVPEFNARVYEITRNIPPGETRTYGQIAIQLGDRLLAQQVGGALGRNPWPIVVPCHRVTAANGKLGGFTARGGAQTKYKLLAIEGAKAAAQTDLFGDSSSGG